MLLLEIDTNMYDLSFSVMYMFCRDSKHSYICKVRVDLSNIFLLQNLNMNLSHTFAWFLLLSLHTCTARVSLI